MLSFWYERMRVREREKWFVLLPLVLFLLGSIQASDAQTHVVELINADEVVVESDSVNGTVRRLYGNVVLRQDTVRLRAARATQYEQRGEIFLEGSVRIISGDDTLTARRVTYDSNEKVAEAVGNVRISDGESVLLAPSATYFSRQKLATFTEGGRLLHEDVELTAPAGHYSTRDKLAEFEGLVELRDSTVVLTSQFGTYDTRAEKAVFSGEVRLLRRGVRIEADSLIYYRRTEVSIASGHVVLERFGNAEDDPDGGIAPDSTQRSVLFGAFVEHDAQRRTVGGECLDSQPRVAGVDDFAGVRVLLQVAPTEHPCGVLTQRGRRKVGGGGGGLKLAKCVSRGRGGRFRGGHGLLRIGGNGSGVHA